MGTSYNPRIVTDGLVFCVDAANKRSYPGSGSTWNDLTANKNNVTLVNGPSFTNNNAGGIAFDGTNDKGTFTSSASSSLQSCEVWTNCIASASAANGYAYIMHNNGSDTTTGNSYLTIGIRPTQEYYAAFNGAFASMGGGVTANNSNIVQIILTWDGSSQKMYINGNLKNSQSLTSISNTFSNTTSCGDAKDAGSNGYRKIQGNIYIIKTYNRALTPDEIRQNYLATKGRFQ